MSSVLYESWNPATLRHTEVTIDSETGLPLIRHTQNIRPIMEDCRRRSSDFDPHRKNPDGWTLVARVPAVTWREWSRLGITRDPQALNAVLNSREWRYFRTDDGRRL